MASLRNKDRHTSSNGASSSSVGAASASGLSSGSDSSLSDLEESSEEPSSDDEVAVLQKRALQADITPHHRLEKRPQRKTAARASDAWSQLGPRPRNASILEVVVDVPPSSPAVKSGLARAERGSGAKQERQRTVIEVTVETPPRKRPGEPHSSTPKGKERAVEELLASPSKKRPPTTPHKQTQATTPRKPATPVGSRGAKRSASKVLPRETGEAPSNLHLIQPTSSDAYFAQHAPRSKQRSSKHQTSDNVISGSLPGISAKAVSQLSASISHRMGAKAGSGPASMLGASHFEPHYEYWWSLLVCTNRPLLIYGVGSKRIHLQHFAQHLASRGRCACVVVRGESGGRIEDVIREMERCMSMPVTTAEQKQVASTPLEARANALVKVMEAGGSKDGRPSSIFILIHSFDSAQLLQERSLIILALLSACRRIHLCVDTCHVNSGLIAQMHSESPQSNLPWLWINLTTYVPMLEEILHERGVGVSRTIGLPRVLDIRAAGGSGFDMGATLRDLSHPSGAHANSVVAGSLLSEQAAIHILRSVTSKARSLFLLFAARLLQGKNGHSATTYGILARLARDNFLAMTSDALRSLLVEFTSHGLFRIEGQSAESAEHSQGLVQVAEGASVTIALSKTDLAVVVDEFRGKG